MTEFAEFGATPWGLKHGHLLVMGGYQLVNEDFKKYEEHHRPGYFGTSRDWDAFSKYQKRRREFRLQVLTVRDLIEENRKFELPRITEKKIFGRSKEDGLSRLLAVLQISWFTIQCIARGRQGLALTELELVTLAIISITAMLHAFWWHKPLGVAAPVNVYVKVEEVGIRREGEGEIDRIEEPMGEKIDRTGKENKDSESEELDRIIRAVRAPLIALQIPDHIRDILDPRKHWLTTSQASVELIQAETATEWRTATLLFLLWMISKIYGALRLLFVWLPLFLLFNLTYYV